MGYRQEFPLRVKEAAFERSNGVCQCGCGVKFGTHPKERPHYDHVLNARMGGKGTLDNCEVLRVSCHEAKTLRDDTPKIAKINREVKRQRNISAVKVPMPGSKGSGMRRGFDGVVRFEGRDQ